VAVAVAGVAGSGKSTLGRALARALGAPLLDLDSLTNPLLDALPPEVFTPGAGHADPRHHGAEPSTGQGSARHHSAESGTSQGGAPHHSGESSTSQGSARERSAGSGAGWSEGHWLGSPYGEAIRDGRYAVLRAAAVDALDTAGAAVMVAPFTAELRGGEDYELLREAVGEATLTIVHLGGDPALFAERRVKRGASRDQHRVDVPAPGPAVEVVTVDAELTTEQQLIRVLAALGRRRAVEPSSLIFGRDFDAVLFDLDGTLVDSTASVLRSWRRFSHEFGIHPDAVAENHGRPARALLDMVLPAERVEDGLARVTEIEIEDAVALPRTPGAWEFFESVPEACRAIVTSGASVLAEARLRAAGIPVPAVMVTADDIRRGKPDPEPYLLGAERLGVAPERCLVVEDAVAGVRSGLAAGCAVLALTGTTSADELKEAGLVVDALDQLRIEVTADGRVRIIPA
jgi:mannitol-1-/sugar-/sorbitol-6-phosphatase